MTALYVFLSGTAFLRKTVPFVYPQASDGRFMQRP